MAELTLQMLRTAVANNAPANDFLRQGEIAVEIGGPVKLWVGVPHAADVTGRVLLLDISKFVDADDLTALQTSLNAAIAAEASTRASADAAFVKTDGSRPITSQMQAARFLAKQRPGIADGYQIEGPAGSTVANAWDYDPATQKMRMITTVNPATGPWYGWTVHTATGTIEAWGNKALLPNWLTLTGNAPTIQFLDIDHRGAFIRMDGTGMYFLRADDSQTGWTMVPGRNQWPMVLNVETGDLLVAGNITASGSAGMFCGFLQSQAPAGVEYYTHAIWVPSEYSPLYWQSYHQRGVAAGLLLTSPGASSYRFEINTGRFIAAGDLIAGASDARLKRNVRPLVSRETSALEMLGKLHGYRFDWDPDGPQPQRGAEVGLLAQELGTVLPELIEIAGFDRDERGGSKSGKHYMAIRKSEGLVALLVEGVQELKTQVLDLQARCRELDRELVAVRRELAADRGGIMP